MTFLKKAPSRQKLGLWDKIGTFWDHFWTFSGLLVVFNTKETQVYV